MPKKKRNVIGRDDVTTKRMRLRRSNENYHGLESIEIRMI